MKAMILSVGDEVLQGNTVNTNQSYISKNLINIGFEIEKAITVGDDDYQIENSVRDFLKSDSKLLVTTGGLGPTHDDFTKESIAKVLNLELVYYKECHDLLDNYFKGRSYDKCNLKQTYYPKGSIILKNNYGTACGCLINYNDKIIVILVGPPFELKPMFEDCVKNHLSKLLENEILITNYLIMGVGESQIEPTIVRINSHYPNVTINPYFQIGAIRYQITSKASHEDEFNNCISEFEDVMKEFIISHDDLKIEEVLVKRMKELNYTISTAESATGGLIASTIINVSGSSSCIKESYITYSDEAKNKILGVSFDTIKKYDVESNEVALEMVNGLKQITGSDICVSVTGICGPTSFNPKKEVGTIYFGLTIGNDTYSYEKIFKGTRNIIRQRAVMFILFEIYKKLR